MSPRLVVVGGLVAAVWFGAACSTPPKPPELESFEKLRAHPAAMEASKKAPDLMTNADRLLAEAREKWQKNDLEECRNSALVGEIKLKQALALAEQDQAKKRIATMDEQGAKATDELGRLEKDLAGLNDQIALLKKLSDAASERQKLAEQLNAAQQKATAEKQTLADQLATEKQKAAAGEKIADAELALKTADTVNAASFAKIQYSAAADMLKRAQQELAQGDFKAAETSAELAIAKAGEATTAARPVYTQEAQSVESRTRAEALSRDAAALPRLMVRRDSRGSLQRLVLPIPVEELFDRRDTTIGAGKGGILDDIAALLKKYSSFPVQVVGYTDTRGRAGELLALSMARAQSVFSALVLRGVGAQRMVVSGQGGAEPISDNRTPAGRARNNRVEIIFLYQ